jgi:hypothetical protein
MNINPKTFYAAREFSHLGVTYHVGDVVPAGRTLADVLEFDAGFVVEDRPAKTGKPTTTPADEADNKE